MFVAGEALTADYPLVCENQYGIRRVRRNDLIGVRDGTTVCADDLSARVLLTCGIIVVRLPHWRDAKAILMLLRAQFVQVCADGCSPIGPMTPVA